MQAQTFQSFEHARFDIYRSKKLSAPRTSPREIQLVRAANAQFINDQNQILVLTRNKVTSESDK